MTLFQLLLSLLTISQTLMNSLYETLQHMTAALAKKAVSVSNQKLLKASPSSLLLAILLLAHKLAHSKLQAWSRQHIKLEW